MYLHNEILIYPKGSASEGKDAVGTIDVLCDFSRLSLTARGIRTFEKRKAILSWLLNSVSEHSYRLEKCLFAIFSHDIKPYCLYKLFRFGMADSPTCAFCQTEVESIEHLLFSC